MPTKYIRLEQSKPVEPPYTDDDDLDEYMKGPYREYMQELDEIKKTYYRDVYYSLPTILAE